MAKYAVAEITHILSTEYNEDLQIIEAESKEQAIEIYKSDRPWIDQYDRKIYIQLL